MKNKMKIFGIMMVALLGMTILAGAVSGMQGIDQREMNDKKHEDAPRLSMKYRRGHNPLLTFVSINNDGVRTDDIRQGETVQVKVTVKNIDYRPVVLSSSLPVPLHFRLYKDFRLVEEYEYEPEHVIPVAFFLDPYEEYTATFDWQVDREISEGAYMAVCWAGESSPGLEVFNILDDGVDIYTDSKSYSTDDKVSLHIENEGEEDVSFGAGFTVEDESGKTVISRIMRHIEALSPGEEVVYDFDLVDDDGRRLAPGTYYIYTKAADEPVTIVVTR
ncbi:MAG: hypothetical protein R6U61_01075 [Thermoplasmata archaeon]